MNRLASTVVVLGLLASAARAEDSLQYGLIPKGHLLMPEGKPGAVIVLASDAGGWTAADEAAAQSFRAEGAAVIGIDMPALLQAVRASEDDCVYIMGDIEELSHEIQRGAGTTSYAAPILAGAGAGGALVLDLVAQLPDATSAGAIAVDPLDGLPLARELCTEAEETALEGRRVYGLQAGALAAPVSVIFTPAATATGRAHVAAIAADHPDVERSDTPLSAQEALAQAVRDRLGTLAGAEDPLGLPLTVLDATPRHDTVALVWSGDGGWRDIDMEISKVFQAEGVPVVGLDSLRYFWSERTPEETARDLERMIDAYRARWHVKHVLLAGYSFGADVLPAAYNALPEADKAAVRQISLLALSQEVTYEVSVGGWLGLPGDGSKSPVRDIRKIDPSLVQCIYGTEEEGDDPCPTLKDAGVEVIPIEGGHHFDGDYKALAEKVLAGLTRRLGSRSGG